MCIDVKLLKIVRNKVYLRYIRMKVRTKNGIGGFLRRNPVLINQAEWNKEKTAGKKNEKTKKVKKKAKKIVKKSVANKKRK